MTLKMSKGPKNVTMLNILDAIHDPDGRDLLNSIATDRQSNDTSDYAVKITRKQYYARLSKLVKADLVKRTERKYVLTPFGKVIYSGTTRICRCGRRAFEIEGRLNTNFQGFPTGTNIRTRQYELTILQSPLFSVP